MKLRESIEQAWQNRETLSQPEVQDAIKAVIEEVDKGRLRVAEPPGGAVNTSNEWQVNGEAGDLIIFWHSAHANMERSAF
jgi:2,3,4,5-tetrahydropyridine-2-carboxylate N-succinyltransferase